jgi:prophage tail gpP-like protein
MSVTVKVNGQTFDLFKQVDVERDLDAFSGSCQIVITEQVNDLSFLQIGNEIEIFLDDNQVFDGYVESGDEFVSDGEHSINYQARDKVCDIVDSTIPDNVKYIENVSTFKSLVEKVITGLNIQNMKVTDNTNANFNDVVFKTGEIGAKCGEWLEEYARYLYVFLNNDGKGNVLIRQPEDKLQTLLVTKDGFEENNIISSSLNVDFKDRYHTYIYNSSGNMATANSDDMDDFIGQTSSATDTEIRSSRVLEIVPDKIMAMRDMTYAAKEEANIRRARSFKYSCRVIGFSANNELWADGMLVDVKDYVKNVIGTFLIKNVKYSFSEAGEITDMQLTYPDAYKGVVNLSKANVKSSIDSNYINNDK